MLYLLLSRNGGNSGGHLKKVTKAHFSRNQAAGHWLVKQIRREGLTQKDRDKAEAATVMTEK